MVIKNNYLTDEKIISLLAINNASAWEYVYNRYVLMMYGEVLRMTDNKTATENFLVKAL